MQQGEWRLWSHVLNGTGVRVKLGPLQPRIMEELPIDAMSPLFQAVLVDELKRILAKYRRGR